MSKLGKSLIKAAKEALIFAKGLKKKSRVHKEIVPGKISDKTKKINSKL